MLAKLSPRAWGWSENRIRIICGNFVIPARVGMVRVEPIYLKPVYRYPLARGDGPFEHASVRCVLRFSPRPWGWSVADITEAMLNAVFPTRVGMVRTQINREVLRFGYPHARGDGPHPGNRIDFVCPLSPRSWGWSVFGTIVCIC